LRVSYEHADASREAIMRAIEAGFQHIVLGLPAPYPDNVARWITTELLIPST
jgi:hypothetical protein